MPTKAFPSGWLNLGEIFFSMFLALGKLKMKLLELFHLPKWAVFSSPRLVGLYLGDEILPTQLYRDYNQLF